MRQAHPTLLLLPLCLHLAAGSDAVTLGVSNDPAYDKQLVTFTCSFPELPYVVEAQLHAFNGSTHVGTITCAAGGLKMSGIWLGTTVNGTAQCRPPGTTTAILQNFTTNHTANESFALDYLCSVVYANPNLQPANSSVIRLQVYVAPQAPQLTPTRWVFNDGDNFSVACVSDGGRPAANLSLIIREKSDSITAKNVTSVAIVETASSKWHNATVTCSVENHHLANMTSTALLQINYINVHGSPLPVSTASGNATLDCSEFVESFPEPTYIWTAPQMHNVTTSISSRVVVLQGQGGYINCSASNTVTGKSVTVVFDVTSDVIVLPSTAAPFDPTGIIIGVVVAIVIVIIAIFVVLFILYRRGHFVKRKPSDIYSNNNTYAEGVSNNDQDRLLIAATGLVANLKHKVLRRTCLVEFSEQSASLSFILDAIRRAVPAQQRFEHVALLLRSTDEGLLLSRPDSQLINSSTVSGSRPLHNFLLSLTKLTLDQSSGNARIDLLNDAGAGSNHVRSELVEALVDLLKVPASVSGDLYGISTAIDQSGGTVADLYFDRQRIDDIVYAEIIMPKEPRLPTAHGGDDRVVYSEVRPLK